MPIIITPPGAPVQTLRHESQASTFPPVSIRHDSRASTYQTRSLAHLSRVWTGPRIATIRHLAVTGLPQVQTLRHDSVVRTDGRVAPPPLIFRKGAPQRYTGATSPKGNVISAAYTHSGTRETLTMTVEGVSAPTPDLSLNVFDSDGNTIAIQVDGDLFQYEIQQTPTGAVTVLYGENYSATRLGIVRCLEYVPWKLSPTPPPDRRVPCAARAPLQEVTVSTLVVEAFAAAGMSLAFINGDPLLGLTWKEQERDYSTAGKTPDQIFAESYGAAGYGYVVRGKTAVLLGPAESITTMALGSRDLVVGSVTRGAAANTPALVTVTGADLLVNRPDLITLALEAPDTSSLIREIAPDYEWYVTTPTADGETIKGFRKVAGQVTYTNELTRSDVTVKETVNGAEQTRLYAGVVTGYTSTTTRYDPYCTDAMIYQETVKTSFGYGLSTDTHLRAFSGPGWGGSYNVGDVLADEVQTVVQTFSAEGYLQTKSTTNKKLVTLQQVGADGPLAGRGALTAREYTTQILSESYQPLQGAKWLRIWNLSGAQQLPLYDTASGDAIRLASRGAALNNGQDVLDQAPSQVTCPDQCSPNRIAYPQTARRSIADGREGAEVTRALPFVTSRTSLEGYTSVIAASLAPTTTRDLTLAGALDIRPGVKLTGVTSGTVQSLSIDASAGFATVKVSTVELKASSSSEAPAISGNGPFRDMVLWRLPGGVVVNHLTGFTTDGTPVLSRVFVRATGANLPAPTQEIEWRDDTRFGPTATGNYG
jgi:hypothetical protein